jgi:hypothetical protein
VDDNDNAIDMQRDKERGVHTVTDNQQTRPSATLGSVSAKLRIDIDTPTHKLSAALEPSSTWLNDARESREKPGDGDCFESVWASWIWDQII